MVTLTLLLNRLLFPKEFREYKRLWNADAPIFHRPIHFAHEKGLGYYVDKFGCLNESICMNCKHLCKGYGCEFSERTYKKKIINGGVIDCNGHIVKED